MKNFCVLFILAALNATQATAPAQIFFYTGAETTITLNPGIYDITAFGAAGGSGGYLSGGGGGGSYIDSSAVAVLAEVSGISSPDNSPNGEIIISPVPEPTTFSLLVLGGLAGLRLFGKKMKTIIRLALVISFLGATAASSVNCFAQTQIVTLAVPAVSGASQVPSASYTVTTNQVIQIISVAGQLSSVNVQHSSGVSLNIGSSGTYTGLTNISVSPAGSLMPTGTYNCNSLLVTLAVTTPPNPANVVSNYIPADAIVIPASATGNVQIILESSPDLVNWTAASPGTYGASAGTNRFFRVRAVASP